jgi:hypothetical protein
MCNVFLVSQACYSLGGAMHTRLQRPLAPKSWPSMLQITLVCECFTHHAVVNTQSSMHKSTTSPVDMCTIAVQRTRATAAVAITLHHVARSHPETSRNTRFGAINSTLSTIDRHVGQRTLTAYSIVWEKHTPGRL